MSFGEIVPVAADAPAIDRLVGLGRDVAVAAARSDRGVEAVDHRVGVLGRSLAQWAQQ